MTPEDTSELNLDEWLRRTTSSKWSSLSQPSVVSTNSVAGPVPIRPPRVARDGGGEGQLGDAEPATCQSVDRERRQTAERPLFDQVTATTPDLPPCPVDTELADGDTVDFGDGAQVIATPGHTDGSIAIWVPGHGVLFTGDIVANGPSGLLLGPFNTDRARARESLAALAQTPAQVVCFGHGDPLVGGAGATAWRELGVRCQAGPDAVPDPLG